MMLGNYLFLFLCSELFSFMKVDFCHLNQVYFDPAIYSSIRFLLLIQSGFFYFLFYRGPVALIVVRLVMFFIFVCGGIYGFMLLYFVL